MTESICLLLWVWLILLNRMISNSYLFFWKQHNFFLKLFEMRTMSPVRVASNSPTSWLSLLSTEDVSMCHHIQSKWVSFQNCAWCSSVCVPVLARVSPLLELPIIYWTASLPGQKTFHSFLSCNPSFWQNLDNQGLMKKDNWQTGCDRSPGTPASQSQQFTFL